MTEANYDTNLLKGTGLIEETLILVEAYEKGISKKEFYHKVFELDLLSKSTENRVQDIVKLVFFRRFWDDEIDVPNALKKLRANFVSIDVLRQLILIYTTRANAILGDFIKEVYNDLIRKSFQKMESSYPKDFIKEAFKDGRIEKPWSDSSVQKVSEHIIACLIDFGFIDRSKNILPVQLFDTSANYLAHELHFRRLTDDQILHHPDWQLFDLDHHGVAEKLQRISWQGHFLFQYSGELLRISWKYKTMEEFIDGLTHK